MPSMLEEAMIDAAALKEAALKNAEAAVIEAARPRIEEALRMLLEQEEDPLESPSGDLNSIDIDMGQGQVSGVASKVPLGVVGGEKMCPCPEDEEEIEIDFADLERQMAADEGTPEQVGGQDDLASSLGLSAPGDDLGVPMEPEDDDEEDINLSEDFIASLSRDDSAEDKEHTGKTCAQAHSEMTHSEWTHKGDVVSESEEKKEELEEKVISPDAKAHMSHAAHKDYLASKEKEKKPSEPAKKHKSLGQEFDFEDDDSSSLELAREGKMIITKDKLTEIIRSATGKLFKEQAEKDKEILNLKNLLRKLSSEMKDTNLQNARLLYTNQILESVSLNERQKRKIVEAVSKAGSIEEAKVIYETLQSSVGSSSQKERNPKSLKEAVERRSTPLIARHSKPENKSNPAMERMKKLAGI